MSNWKDEVHKVLNHYALDTDDVETIKYKLSLICSKLEKQLAELKEEIEHNHIVMGETADKFLAQVNECKRLHDENKELKQKLDSAVEILEKFKKFYRFHRSDMCWSVQLRADKLNKSIDLVLKEVKSKR